MILAHEQDVTDVSFSLKALMVHAKINSYLSLLAHSLISM